MHGKRRLKKFVNQETEICILYTAMFQIFPTSTESSCNFCVTLGPSMSYYPVFISILSKFDPNLIKCYFFLILLNCIPISFRVLKKLTDYTNFIPSLSRKNRDKNWMKARIYFGRIMILQLTIFQFIPLLHRY